MLVWSAWTDPRLAPGSFLTVQYFLLYFGPMFVYNLALKNCKNWCQDPAHFHSWTK